MTTEPLLSEQQRLAVLYLVLKWPTNIPLTKAWAVESVFLIDKENNDALGLEWNLQYYARCLRLEKALDQLGCLRTIKNTLEKHDTSFSSDSGDKPIRDAIDKYVEDLSSCVTLADAYQIRSRVKNTIKAVKVYGRLRDE